jgi:hypothetical protein
VRQSPRLSGSSDQGNPGSARSLQHSGHHGRVLPRAPGHAASGIGDGRSALRPVTVNKCVRGPRTVVVVLSCPTFTLQNQRKKRADERTRTADLISLRVRGRRLGRSELQKASKGWETSHRTKTIGRKRYRLPLSVQGVIPSRQLGQLSYRLSSRNRSSVEGEWFW